MSKSKQHVRIVRVTLTMISLAALLRLPAGRLGPAGSGPRLAQAAPSQDAPHSVWSPARVDQQVPPFPLGGAGSGGRGQRPSATHTVCPDGPPTCDYQRIQDAVDAAGENDVIKVATGVYSDLHGRPAAPGFYAPAVITQVVYLSKTVTLLGGYDTSFNEPPDPVTNPTTLDALGQGRVLYIAGQISPTIVGLRLTGGYPDGVGGTPWGLDGGGGVYAISATLTFSGNWVFDNGIALGGGLFLAVSTAILSGNVISSNNAINGGGGLYLLSCTVTLSGNVISANSAYYDGGGLQLHQSTAAVERNTISDNTAGQGSGGGLNVFDSSVTLMTNTVSSNTAARFGGGLSVVSSDASLVGNIITSNVAVGPFGFGNGGGLHFFESPATVRANIISANSARRGGGLNVREGPLVSLGNIVSSNTAEYGGGLFLTSSTVTLTNDIISDNEASIAAGGLYVEVSSPRLLHTTIARNHGGDGSGLYVDRSIVALTNTILVSHTVGITVTTGSTATLEATLWGSGVWANETDWGGAGTIVTGTVNIWGDPAFADPDTGDYHIGMSSAAIDAGVDAGVVVDIDGEPRPQASGYDIGADELWVGPIYYIFLPVVLRGM